MVFTTLHNTRGISNNFNRWLSPVFANPYPDSDIITVTTSNIGFMTYNNLILDKEKEIVTIE